MINVVLKGVDEFLGSHVEAVLSPVISNALKLKDEEIVFTCLHSVIYKGGIDQTSYHMIITLELDEKYRSFESKLAKVILPVTKNFAVHAHLNFSYINGKQYSRIDEEYPLYITSSNSIEVDADYEDLDDEDEIYTGNIFADFDEQLKKNDK